MDEDGLCLIDLDVWMNSKQTDEHLRTTHPIKDVGERKGLKKHVTRLTKETDEFASSAGNEAFHTTSEDYKTVTIKTLTEIWTEAFSVFLPIQKAKLYIQEIRNMEMQLQ